MIYFHICFSTQSSAANSDGKMRLFFLLIKVTFLSDKSAYLIVPRILRCSETDQLPDLGNPS